MSVPKNNKRCLANGFRSSVRAILPFFFLVSSLSAQKPNQELIRGKVFLEEGKYTEAIQQLSAAVEAEPELPEIYLSRSKAYLESGRTDLAEKDLKMLEKFSIPEASFGLARLYALSGRDTLAIEYLKKHLASEGRYPRKQIMTEPAFGKLERTRLWVRLWSDDWYTADEELAAEAGYLLSAGNPAEALALLEPSAVTVGTSAELLLIRAHCYELLSNRRAAQEDYNAALLKKGPDAVFFSERAGFYSRSGRHREARNDLNRAVALAPNDINLLVERAGVLVMLGEYELAAGDFDLYLSYNPGDVQVNRQAGRSMLDSGQPLKALEYFNRNLENDRSRPELFIDRADAYLAARTWKYAFEDYSQALDLDPSDGRVYLKRGQARMEMNDSEGACYDWNRAWQLGEKSAVSFLQQHCR